MDVEVGLDVDVDVGPEVEVDLIVVLGAQTRVAVFGEQGDGLRDVDGEAATHVEPEIERRIGEVVDADAQLGEVCGVIGSA
jgi:hypothetical protein